MSTSNADPRVRGAEPAAIEVAPGISRQMTACGTRIMLCRFTLRRGAVVPAHHHLHEQAGFVVSGVVELTVADRTTILKGGDCYCIPGGDVHSSHVLEDAVVMDCFSPPREDYLPPV
jgi:quercetin dioxygenase-like cupin family protein